MEKRTLIKRLARYQHQTSKSPRARPVQRELAIEPIAHFRKRSIPIPSDRPFADAPWLPTPRRVRLARCIAWKGLLRVLAV